MLVARLLVGGIFLYTGWLKVSDLGMAVSYFGQLGVPAFLAYIISFAELLGGLAIVLGIWAEFASIGLGVIMIGAMWFGFKAAPSLGASPLQLIMPNIAILSALLMVIVSGAGKFAVPMKKKTAPVVA